MNRTPRNCCVLIALWILASVLGVAQTAADPSATFAPLERWKNAVLAGDSVALQSLYSVNPAAKVMANEVEGDASADIRFWIGLKARGMKIDMVRVKTRNDLENVIFNAEIATNLPGGQTVVVADDQIWQKQADQWHLRFVTRTDAPHLKQPSSMTKDIYPADADASVELKAAEEQAAKDHKRVLLVFGANWCYDCHVLDLAFQRPDLAPLLAANYEVVHVDLGPDEHKNADLVAQYQVPLNKGIPALAVAENDGKLVVSQKNGEFENTRGLTPEALVEFLNQWKPAAQ